MKEPRKIFQVYKMIIIGQDLKSETERQKRKEREAWKVTEEERKGKKRWKKRQKIKVRKREK